MDIRINLVEDEDSLRNILRSYLEREGYLVEAFSDGEAALPALGKGCDLWILDINLPGMDGFELFSRIRDGEGEVPVIYISARDRDVDRVVGLELGAEDYLAKPFLPRELMLRVDRILKRSHARVKPRPLELAGYSLSAENRTVFRERERVELSSKEFDILLLLCQNRRRAFERQELIDRVWGEGYAASPRVVDDLIRRLRSKMKELPLESIYGFGYRMN